MAIGPACDFTAATISSIVVGSITWATTIGFSLVTSLMIGGDGGRVTLVRAIPISAAIAVRSRMTERARGIPFRARQARRATPRAARAARRPRVVPGLAAGGSNDILVLDGGAVVLTFSRESAMVRKLSFVFAVVFVIVVAMGWMPHAITAMQM